jgi:hypothetical protein
MDEPQRTMECTTAGTPSRGPSIKELAESQLRGSAYLALQHVTCEFRAGVLTLRGRLSSYYLKQIAQAAVAPVDGVKRIDNRIEVVAPPSTARMHAR